MLLGLLAVGAIGVVAVLGSMSSEETYGSKLEQYIVSNNPQNAADIDRLAKEYQEKESRRFL